MGGVQVEVVTPQGQRVSLSPKSLGLLPALRAAREDPSLVVTLCYLAPGEDRSEVPEKAGSFYVALPENRTK